MPNLVKARSIPAKSTPTATRVLVDYSYWLVRHYGHHGNYLTNAKTFLRTLKSGGTVISQLETYAEGKSLTMQSILRRFRKFLEEKNIVFIANDLFEKPLPRSNIYVKIFLLHRKDRLRGDNSSAIYATVLSQYFRMIKEDTRFFNKKTAEKFIHAPNLSDYTVRLYRSILKNFCEWTLKYQLIPDKDLNAEQRRVKKGLKRISAQSLREIVDISVPTGKSQTGTYHKDSLDEKQRLRMLKVCESSRERAIVSLMGWNGFRKIEVKRLRVVDCDFKRKRIAVWGKGRSSRNREWIKFFAITRKEIMTYLKETKTKSGPMFPGLTLQHIEDLVARLFTQMKLRQKNAKYTPHSLRHSTGQNLYNSGVPLEFIQKTLRHSSLKTTMVYAQKAIDKQYWIKMPDGD